MSERIYSGSKQTASTGLPLIRCECGQEILLVPDAKVMSRCIEAHVELHKQNCEDHKEAQSEAARIRNLLVSQILQKAAEQQRYRNSF